MVKPTEGSVKLGGRIKIARENAGLSQAQLAKFLGLHRPSVTDIESGRRTVSAEEAKRISEILDVDLNWVLGIQNPNDPRVSDRILLAARELAKIKEEDLEKVIDLLKQIRGSEQESKK